MRVKNVYRNEPAGPRPVVASNRSPNDCEPYYSAEAKARAARRALRWLRAHANTEDVPPHHIREKLELMGVGGR